MCDRQFTKKYVIRKSPAYPAQACRNTVKIGNDGHKYLSKRSCNGVYRWVLKSKSLRSKKAKKSKKVKRSKNAKKSSRSKK